MQYDRGPNKNGKFGREETHTKERRCEDTGSGQPSAAKERGGSEASRGPEETLPPASEAASPAHTLVSDSRRQSGETLHFWFSAPWFVVLPCSTPSK